jgi:hypothetical protein
MTWVYSQDVPLMMDADDQPAAAAPALTWENVDNMPQHSAACNRQPASGERWETVVQVIRECPACSPRDEAGRVIPTWKR